MSETKLSGAAERAMTDYLLDNPYLPDWDERHERIAHWHLDKSGHRVCGCGVHQAFCWDCDMPRIVEYENEKI